MKSHRPLELKAVYLANQVTGALERVNQVNTQVTGYKGINLELIWWTLSTGQVHEAIELIENNRNWFKLGILLKSRQSRLDSQIEITVHNNRWKSSILLSLS